MAVRGARRRRALIHKLDLHSLDAFGEARAAGDLSVLGPTEPADVLDVDAIIDVVAVGELARELDFERLHAEGLARGAGHGAVGHPVLPADVLHVGLVGDAAGVRRAVHLQLERLDAEAAARSAGRRAVRHPALPADVLHMGAVLDAEVALEGPVHSRGGDVVIRGARAVLHDLDLDGLQTQRVAHGARGLAILGPGGPTVVLHMDAIIDVVALACVPLGEG